MEETQSLTTVSAVTAESCEFLCKRSMVTKGVRVLVLDAAVLFQHKRCGSVELLPDAPRFLCRLRYSSLFLGVLSLDDRQELVAQKEALLEKIGVLEAVRLVAVSHDLSVKEALENLGSLWGVHPTSFLYVTAQHNDSIEGCLIHQGFNILRFDPENEVPESQSDGAVTVKRLPEILAVIGDLNKRALGPMVLVVGYTMKWSRELDFLKRSALPIVPNEYGLSFLPLELDQPLEKQLVAVDVILHKATDEILRVRSGQVGVPDSLQFSEGILELQRYLQNHPQICVVDPLDRVLPLLDRVVTQAILQNLKIPAQQIIRSPRCVEVTTFDEPWLSQALESGNVMLPTIVKPRVACGVSEAHTMAVVFEMEGFKALPVPLPAIIQVGNLILMLLPMAREAFAEYIDHGAFQYKMYVVGDKLLYSQRQSTPNGSALAGANNGASSVVFDSLKSLPLLDTATHGEHASEGLNVINIEAVQATATWLRKEFHLTIFGFDIVVQAGTNDYIIVDVNYFPSFKDIPDLEAIPAFWDALLTAHHQWTTAP